MAQWILMLNVLVVAFVGVESMAATAQPASSINKAKHPFCTRPPNPQRPQLTIFVMDVKTGFPKGYRSNQTVIVEVRAEFPAVWRIKQFFVTIPDDNPAVHRSRANDYRYHKSVGHWAWNLVNTDPDVGSTKPVDCGGLSSYGPFGMMSNMGAHAAMEVGEDPSQPRQGWSSIVAKWVPPTDMENLVFRKQITVTAYVTFEMESELGAYRKPRWVKLEATILNLDHVSIQNHFIYRFGPMWQQVMGFSQPRQPAAGPMREF